MTDNSRLETREEEISIEIEQLKNNVTRFTKWSWIFVGIGFVILIIGCGLLAFGQFKGFHEFGDFIGGSVGSIWSLAGLFFVYVAFLGQKQSILNQQIEILYNQEELRATRKELAGQKEQMKLQNATLKQQQFENAFFVLFKYHNDLNQQTAGIRRAYKNYEMYNKLEDLSFIFFDPKIYPSIIKPYLQSIYQLFFLIDEKSNYDKLYYFELVKSVMSKEGIMLLTYFSLHSDFTSLKKIIVKYNLLSDLKPHQLIDKSKDYDILIKKGIIQNPS